MSAQIRGVAVLLVLACIVGSTPSAQAQLTSRATYVDAGSFSLPPVGPDSPRDPVALAVGPGGSVHVVDENGTVFVFSEAGEAEGAYGGGYLGEPVAIAFDDRGSAYVLDQDPKRIQVFNPDREWWYTISSARRGPARLQDPIDVAVGPNGYVYVLDESGPAVRVFGRDGAFVRGIALPPQIDDPAGIAVDGDGTILITARRMPGGIFQMQPFSTPPWIRPAAPQILAVGATGEPVSIVTDGRGTTVILDSDGRRLWGGQRVESDPTLLSRSIYGGQGMGRGSFREPVDIAFTGERDMLILDRELRKVERISLSSDETAAELRSLYPIRVSLLPPDLKGALLAVAGPTDGSTDLAFVSEAQRRVSMRERPSGAFTDFFGHQFRAMSIAPGAEIEGFATTLRDVPGDVAFNDTLLVITEPRQDRFAVYDMRSGASLGTYGSAYEDDRRLDEPRGIALFPDGSIAVADHRNDRIAVFSADLASLLGSFGFPDVHGVAVSRSGELFAWDEAGGRVAQVPFDGAPVSLAGELRPGPVTDVAFDMAGNLFLLEAETSRVTVVSAARDRIFVRFGGRDPEFEASHISVDDVGNVYVSSLERDSTQTYRWDLDLPRLADLQVTLTAEGAGLTWSPIESPFLNGYRILGSRAGDAPFEVLVSTDDERVDLAAEPTGPVRWIQVAPLTIAGTVAAASEAVRLYHLDVAAASDAGEYGMVVGLMERLDEVLTEGTVRVEPALWQELQWRTLAAEAELGYFEAAAAREDHLGGWLGEDGGFTVHWTLAQVHHELGNDSSVLANATRALAVLPGGDATGKDAGELLRMAVPAAFATGAYERVLALGEDFRAHATEDEEYRLIMWLATARVELAQPSQALRLADEVLERQRTGAIIAYGTDPDDLAWTALRSAIRLGDAEAVDRWMPLVNPTASETRGREFQILLGSFQLQQGEIEAALERLTSLTVAGDPAVYQNPAVVELSLGVYRALQEADSVDHAAGLTFLEGYAELIPSELADLREAYGDSITVFAARESTKARLGEAFEAWRDADLFGLVEFLEEVLGGADLTVDEEVLARVLLAGAYADGGRAEEARGELVRVLGFDPEYDAEAANAQATELYQVTPFNETLMALLEDVRNRGMNRND